VERSRLPEREERILRTIIENHVRSARPVGSSAVVRDRTVRVSPATVRNVMRSLEERGLIRQPHTSAGRVPTDRGYRYYVDHLMELSGPSLLERDRIRDGLARLTGSDAAEIATGISKLLSDLSKEMAVLVARDAEADVLERIDLFALEGGRVLAVATTRSGPPRSQTIAPRARLVPREISEAARLLNGWLVGVPLVRADLVLAGRIGQATPRMRDFLALFMAGGSRILRTSEGEHVHYDGARYMFRHPEFASDASALGSIFDSEEALADVVRSSGEASGVTVTIGSESGRPETARMSIVVGAYRMGASVARLGIIGPTRMRYPKLVGLVDYVSGALEEFFS
jgi:heat-inducible transcriptional repressor